MIVSVIEGEIAGLGLAVALKRCPSLTVERIGEVTRPYDVRYVGLFYCHRRNRTS